MVDERITDGKRIAQLLSSELTGLQTGALEAVSVTDADPDAMPTATGTDAYTIRTDGVELATVKLFPEYAEIRFAVDPVTEKAATGSTSLEEQSDTGDRILQVTSGAAVKDAVDVIRGTADRVQQA